MTAMEAYRFHLPEENIAQHPVEPAEDSKLLRLPRSGDVSFHQCMDLASLLPPRCLIVANDTSVVKARLTGHKESGGKLEVLITRAHDPKLWLAMIRGKVKKDDQITLAGQKVKVSQVLPDGFALLDFADCDVLALMESQGQVPLPPYIRRETNEKDRSLYQTSFAKNQGAVAAPTAGLHFTKKLRQSLEEAGHRFMTLTLHVGPGTFLPVRAKTIAEHKVPSESAFVSKELLKAIKEHKEKNRPLVAVGTTVTRTLETLALNFPKDDFSGEVSLTISPPFKFKMVDRLCTNFHLPESSLLLLVAAFSGRERLLSAYQRAIAENYRFYSYGDLCLLE